MTSGKVPAKAFALFAVALMMIVALVPLFSNGSHEAYAVDTGEKTVTYHFDKNDESGTPIKYYGISSAEYNPFNNPSFTNEDGSIGWEGNATTVTNPTVGLTIYFSDVDGGTVTLPDELSPIIRDGSLVYDVNLDDDSPVNKGPNSVRYESGQVLIELPSEGWIFTRYPSGSITIQCTYYGTIETHYVFAGWSKSPVDSDSEIADDVLIEPGDILDEDNKDLYAVWYTPNIQSLITAVLDKDGSNATVHYVRDYRDFGDYTYSYTLHEGCAYTEIIHISGEQETGDYLPMGTYRSADVDNKATLRIQETYNSGRDHDYHIPIGGNVIIDNINLVKGSGCDYSQSHGNVDRGLFANGYKLIIGIGVETGSGTDPKDYPQIFGGNTTNHSAPVDRGISSTDVVIFSGTYYNVVAGNYDGNISGDTRLIIRGDTTVLDTVVGGNSSSNEEYTISNTWIYVLGGCLPGDSYQEKKLETGYTKGVTLTESTILTGGSNNGQITESTNVYISGTAKLWDVQGGGRRGVSGVDTANVEVSGQAAIRHVLCGSITDGLNRGGAGTPDSPNGYNGSVQNVNITIGDNALVDEFRQYAGIDLINIAHEAVVNVFYGAFV